MKYQDKVLAIIYSCFCEMYLSKSQKNVYKYKQIKTKNSSLEKNQMKIRELQNQKHLSFSWQSYKISFEK